VAKLVIQQFRYLGQGSNTVHHETHEILPEGVPLGIHRRGIRPLDCFHGNVWGLGSHVWEGAHHALLCASALGEVVPVAEIGFHHHG